jgi:hypothetical protein
MKWVADLCARGGGNRIPGNRTPRGDKSDPANGGKRNFVAYKDMTDAHKTKMRKDVLAATASTPNTKPASSGPAVFFMSSIVPILAASKKMGHIRQIHDGEWLFKCWSLYTYGMSMDRPYVR